MTLSDTQLTESNTHWTQRPENKAKVRALSRKSWAARRKNKEAKPAKQFVANHTTTSISKEAYAFVTEQAQNAGITRTEVLTHIVNAFKAAGKKIKVYRTVSVE